MTGDDRIRRCGMCALDIYNISEMSSQEVTDLIRNREGRICIHIYRRADGTVQTRDCPSGLRILGRKTKRAATAVAAAILGLVSITYSQRKSTAKPKLVKPEIVQSFEGVRGTSVIKGMVTDVNGALVPSIEILLFRGADNKAVKTSSDVNGLFSFSGLADGIYKIQVAPSRGYSKLIVEGLLVKSNSISDVPLVLSLDRKGVVVGIFVEEPMIDFSVSGPTPVKITREELDRIPGGRPY